MNIGEIRKSLLPKPRLINLVGRENFFKESALREITKTYLKSSPLSENRLVVTTHPMDSIKEFCSTQPYDSLWKVLVYKGKTPDKLVSCLSPHTALVSYDWPLSTPDLTIECFRLFGSKLHQWVKASAKTLDVHLEKEDTERIIDTFGSDAALIHEQLRMLSLLDHPDSATIRLLCEAYHGGTVAGFVEAVLEGRAGKAVDLYLHLSNSGEKDLPLVLRLLREYKGILYQDSGVALEQSEFDAERLKKYKNRFSEKKILLTIQHLLKAETAIKLGEGPNLVHLVVRICQER